MNNHTIIIERITEIAGPILYFLLDESTGECHLKIILDTRNALKDVLVDQDKLRF